MYASTGINRELHCSLLPAYDDRYTWRYTWLKLEKLVNRWFLCAVIETSCLKAPMVEPLAEVANREVAIHGHAYSAYMAMHIVLSMRKIFYETINYKFNLLMLKL